VSAAAAGGGVLRSTDRLTSATMPSAHGKSPAKNRVTFNLEDNDDDDDDDKSISQPIRDACRYCTVCIAYKGVDLTGLLGDIKEDWGSEGRKLFCETTHNICINYNKQQLLLLLDKINLAKTTSVLKYVGDMSPCPIGIDTPDCTPSIKSIQTD